MPRTIAILLTLVIGTSSYVVIEPAPSDLLFVLLLGAVLANRSVAVRIDFHPLLGLGLALFMAGNVGSLVMSANLTKADPARALIYFAVTFYLLLLWYVIVILIENYGTVAWHRIRVAFLFAATFAAVLGFLIPFVPSLQDLLGLRPTFGPRAHAAFKDPNVYSPFLCAAILLVLNDVITRRITLLAMALLGLFAVGVLSAFSRGGYANLAVALCTFIALHLAFVNRRVWLLRTLAIAVLAGLVLTPLLMIYLESMGLEGFLARRMALQHYDSGRFSTHFLALMSFGERPFGIGPGQSDIMLPLSTHNLYLRVALENGVVGLLGWLLFLLTSLWICLKGVVRRGPLCDLYVVCLAVLAGILVNSLVIDTLHWRHFFLFLAVPIGLARYERSRVLRQPLPMRPTLQRVPVPVSR